MHEGDDEKPDAEANSSSCIGALFYSRAYEVVGLTSAFAHNFDRLGCRILGLSIEILHPAFEVSSLALQLGFRVTCRAP